ncbi:GNAT family N-acetyltransferase [Xylanimonas sp. McL0601]|uniref:GNAT family N-acetyltransferase n=1 Tax=Xylanimonas sp. McL0601 TaxID=3414739 RepID=UPI003CEF1648
MSTTGWQVVEVAPGEDPDGWAHRGLERVSRAVTVERDGHDDVAWRAIDSATDLAHQEDEERTLLLAVDDAVVDGSPESVLGWVRVDRQTTANQHAAWVHVEVHPGHRGRGVGSALLARGEQVAARAGRGTLQGEASFAEVVDGPQLPAPTGSGKAPARAPGVRFALAHGYELVQVDRRSTLATPVPPQRLDALEADAVPHADDYRLHAWHGELPEQWLDAFALLETRMSTDAPMGKLDFREDVWDAERVRRSHTALAESGHDFVITAAEHVATRELAAMTMLTWHRDPDAYAFQWDTIVLKPHRGRRLGMLVKSANLRRLAELRPGTLRVHTWNAEENDHMLAINVALGFRPAGGAAMFQKRP